MKRILINGIGTTVIVWLLFYFLSFVWEGEAFNVCAGLFCFFGPVGIFYGLINGYVKVKRFNKLGINYKASIPCYAFLGLFELKNNTLREIKKNESLTYSICLCSTNILYFYECDKSVITLEDFTYEMCDDINATIISINKKEIIKFNYTDFGRSSSDKMSDWIGNKISEHLQGYFTRRIKTQVNMDAAIDVYFKQGNIIKVLTFGIPESLVSSFSIDFYSFLPEFISEANGYISECREILDIYEDDTLHLKRAKKMIRSLFYQIIN